VSRAGQIATKVTAQHTVQTIAPLNDHNECGKKGANEAPVMLVRKVLEQRTKNQRAVVGKHARHFRSNVRSGQWCGKIIMHDNTFRPGFVWERHPPPEVLSCHPLNLG
jgi:hypothetical protein